MSTSSIRRKAERLTALGYRRTSNKHRMVSRIDRPDWLEVLARSMRRSVAEFCDLDTGEVSPSWCDHYRRVYSEDTMIVEDPEVFKLVPTSGHDSVGYVDSKQPTKENTVDQGDIQISSFKYPTSIEWVNGSGPIARKPVLGDLIVGDTFIRNGAICMVVRMCHDIVGVDGANVQRTTKTTPPVIINLQTGSVWTADRNDEITVVKLRVEVTK